MGRKGFAGQRCARPRLKPGTVALLLLRGPEKPVKFSLDNPIALAGCILKLLPLEDTDHAAAVLDQSSLFQFRSHFVDAAATDTQHESQEFLRKRKCFGSYPVMGHQQPPRTSLPNGMLPVAGHSLRN